MNTVTKSDPKSGQQIQIYPRDLGTGEYGIAKHIGGVDHWEYLQLDFTWRRKSCHYFPTKEDAIAHWEKYVASLYPDIPREQAMSEQVAVTSALLIDKVRLRVKFKCPLCKLAHITALKIDRTFEQMKGPRIERHCPKNPEAPKFNVRIFEETPKNPVAPFGDIPQLPAYDCKECFGTGDFVLFTSITPCQCLGKQG